LGPTARSFIVERFPKIIDILFTSPYADCPVLEQWIFYLLFSSFKQFWNPDFLNVAIQHPNFQAKFTTAVQSQIAITTRPFAKLCHRLQVDISQLVDSVWPLLFPSYVFTAISLCPDVTDAQFSRVIGALFAFAQGFRSYGLPEKIADKCMQRVVLWSRRCHLLEPDAICPFISTVISLIAGLPREQGAAIVSDLVVAAARSCQKLTPTFLEEIRSSEQSPRLYALSIRLRMLESDLAADHAKLGLEAGAFALEGDEPVLRLLRNMVADEGFEPHAAWAVPAFASVIAAARYSPGSKPFLQTMASLMTEEQILEAVGTLEQQFAEREAPILINLDVVVRVRPELADKILDRLGIVGERREQLESTFRPNYPGLFGSSSHG
jgi:hypothetical protein